MTNKDHIKSMNSYELATFIHQLIDDELPWESVYKWLSLSKGEKLPFYEEEDVMWINNFDGINFQLGIYDLIEKAEPKSADDLTDVSDELHMLLETAVEDYASESEAIDADEYCSNY